MPIRQRKSKRRPDDEPDDVITGIHAYSTSDGTGGGLLTGTSGYADTWSARAHWPEWRARVWASWEPRPYVPAAAAIFDGIGRQLRPLLVSIPGNGVDADELAEAARADLSALASYEVPADCAEPIATYRRTLDAFVAWVDTQTTTRISCDTLAFKRPWAT